MKVEEKTIVRAVTFPFTPHEPMDWREIDPLLRKAWVASTKLANWVVGEAYMIDRLTQDLSQDRIQPMPEGVDPERS